MQLATADQRMADMQAQVHQLNQQMTVVMGTLNETDRKMNTVEQSILQSSLLRPKTSPAPPTQPVPVPVPATPAPVSR